MTTKTLVSDTSKQDVQAMGVLVTVSLKKPGQRKTDKRIAAQSAEHFKGDESFFPSSKKLFESRTYDEIRTIDGWIRNQIIRRYTFPWEDGSKRLLPSGLIEEFQKKIDEKFGQRQALVQALKNEYEDIILQSKKSLGGAFDEDDYLSSDEFAERFSHGYVLEPLPDTNHFLVDLPAAKIDEIKKNLEQSIHDKMKVATNSAHERTVKLLNDLISGLSRHGKKTGQRSSRFNNFTVELVDELIDVLPALNITGDPRLARAAEDLRNKVKPHLNPDDLRSDENKRKQVIADTEQVVQDLGGLF